MGGGTRRDEEVDVECECREVVGWGSLDSEACRSPREIPGDGLGKEV